jgi:predicted ATPase
MPTTQTHLTHLEAADLVRLAQTRPELEYLFRHALVQDAAYESLLLEQRYRFHRIVAETVEQLYPERLEELAPVLAQHFAAAGDKRRALAYFTQAGDAAARVYATNEAVALYQQAIHLAGSELVAVEPCGYLYSQYGRALEHLGRHDDALATAQARGLRLT